MKTPTLENLSVEEVLRKEPFFRAMPADFITQTGMPRISSVTTEKYLNEFDPLRYIQVTQADFIREYEVTAHKINSIKYYPDPINKDEEGGFYQKVRSRIAIGLQEIIHTKRVNCITGNNVNLRIVNSTYKKDLNKAKELLNDYREDWEMHNIENAVTDFINSDMKVGDAAICFYLQDGKFGYRVLSYDKKSVLYPHYDPITGKLAMLGRKYSVLEDGRIRNCLEVWDRKYYVRLYETREGDQGFKTPEWKVEHKQEHKFPTIPVVYTRYGEPCWANSQDIIDKIELSLSQLAENNMAYALRILYSFGGEMEMKASLDGTPTQINGSDPNSKIGFLEPSDSSKSFELEVATLEDFAYRSSHAVKTPKLSSGSDVSSLTVKMLFADAFQKGQLDAKFYQQRLDEIVEICKYGFGVERNDVGKYNDFKVKAKLFPYIFLSETEEVSNMMQLKSIGGLSARSVSEQAYEMGYGTIDEYDRVLQEEHDKLLAESMVGNFNSTSDVSEEDKIKQGVLGGNTNNPLNAARQALN